MINKYYLGAGAGNGNTELNSFDAALISAGMGNYNLLKVSSILPPKCTYYDRITVDEGQPVYVAYASLTTAQRHVLMSAVIGIGIPKDSNNTGVIMEYSGYCDKKHAQDIVSKMVTDAMRKREYEIERIEYISVESYSSNSCYTTVFAGVALW